MAREEGQRLDEGSKLLDQSYDRNESPETKRPLSGMHETTEPYTHVSQIAALAEQHGLLEGDSALGYALPPEENPRGGLAPHQRK